MTYDPQKGRWPEPVTYCIDFEIVGIGDVIYGTSIGTCVGEAISSFRVRWEDPVIVHDAYPLAFEEKIWGTDEP